MRPNAVIGSAVIGGVPGYLLGVGVACYWLYPGSNMCGIVGFVTGPIGCVAGAVAGRIGSRPGGPAR